MCRHLQQFSLVMGGKVKGHTVSLAPPNAPRGQDEINNNAISKHPFGELNIAYQELLVISFNI